MDTIEVLEKELNEVTREVSNLESPLQIVLNNVVKFV